MKRLFAGYLRRIAAAFLAAVLAAALTGQAVLAADLQPKSEQPKGEQLLLAVGEGEFLTLPRPSLSVFIANPDVADVQVPSSTGIFVLGKKTGTTTLFAVDGDNRVVLRRSVVVRHNLVEIRDLLHQRFPSYNFNLSSAPGSVMIGGVVNNPDEVNAVVNTVTPLLSKDEKLINSLSVQRPTQVQLRVRIVEMSRNITQQFGFNWQALMTPGNVVAGVLNGRDWYNDTTKTYNIATSAWSVLGGYSNGKYNVQTMLDALDAEGLISVMAEPNLTAVSGQTASFLAGGEFPIPVAQSGSSSSSSNAISIEFKPFGVALDFTPTVLSNDRISVMVRPEVSELSSDNGITMNGITIPGLTVRRVETTVELASGQSFAVGGLLQDNMHDSVSRLPGLGNLPVLGKLFSSQDYQNNKSELVVIVTAYLVRPVGGNVLRTPLQSLKPASDVERITQTRYGIDPLAPDAPRLMGAAGFSY
ncbi:MAG TPA: type II and III secretion system protein family protein [Candidatus Sulfotelmatobacter sp.]|nr:type II and III secretion system protein family protein [Candidatus Sulfotelmatobacter sp.]